MSGFDFVWSISNKIKAMNSSAFVRDCTFSVQDANAFYLFFMHCGLICTRGQCGAANLFSRPVELVLCILKSAFLILAIRWRQRLAILHFLWPDVRLLCALGERNSSGTVHSKHWHVGEQCRGRSSSSAICYDNAVFSLTFLEFWRLCRFRTFLLLCIVLCRKTFLFILKRMHPRSNVHRLHEMHIFMLYKMEYSINNAKSVLQSVAKCRRI